MIGTKCTEEGSENQLTHSASWLQCLSCGHSTTTVRMMPGDADAADDRKDDAEDDHRDSPTKTGFIFDVIERAVQQIDDSNSIVYIK